MQSPHFLITRLSNIHKTYVVRGANRWWDFGWEITHTFNVVGKLVSKTISYVV